MIGARFGDIQCGSINTDGNGVWVLELAPMSNNGLRTWINGKAAHGQHRSGSIHGEYDVPVAADAKDATQIRFLNGGGGLTLAMGRLQTGSVEEE